MKLFYKKYGTTGKPLFILHGIFGMLDNWHNIAKQLSEQYTVYTIDARNHGQSPHSDEMSYQLMAEDVIEMADDLGIDQFILMGHSMGGKTALWIANQFGNRIDQLILVDIAPKTYKPGHLSYFEAFKNIPWHTLTSRKEVDDALMTYETDMGVRLFLAKNIDRNLEGSFTVKTNFPVIQKAYAEIIGALHFTNVYNGPVLFILGAKSHYLSEDDKPYIEQYFPNAEYASISNAGHWVHADNPVEFLQVLRDFLTP
ncbi:MAG: alpha/beta fold hydrolase [Bacteroidota bacterium]